MKRNKIVCVALVIIMLLNCILPLVKVNAEETQQNNSLQEIQLNDKLYYAIKSYLTQNPNANIKAYFNDHDLTIKVDPSLIKRLDLNEAGIYDLTGLNAFTNLEHLELSGNKLNKDSNLNVLNSFNNDKFTYLDLSSNQLEDISEISGLVNKLEAGRDAGKEMTIVLSGQHVTMVETKSDLKSAEDNDTSNNEKTTTFNLPPILEKAGFLKNIWSTITYRKQYNPNVEIIQATNPNAEGYLYTKLPSYVSGNNSTLRINISDGENSLYEGVVHVKIKIGDDYTEDETPTNLNYAKRNPLVDSEFDLYYVITDDRYEAIPIKDRNLYDAIKAQLLAGQDINPNLPNYLYKTEEENVEFADYQYKTITIDDTVYHALYKEVDSSNNPVYEYLYNPLTEKLYICETSPSTGDPLRGDEVEKDVKSVEITLDDGTLKRGYRVSDKTSIENDINTLSNLFAAAYDDAQAFVIKDDVLINTIKTLLINNEQISDLTGIEKFVGLTSNLNISHNNLINIDPLAALEENKSATEQQIKEKYSYWLTERRNGNLSDNNTKCNNYVDIIKDNMKKIEAVRVNIVAKLAEYVSKEIDADKEAEEANNLVKAIEELIKPVYDYTEESDNGEVKVIKGYTTLIKEALDSSDANDEDLKEAIEESYTILEKLYSIYNDEYKLTSLLADELNYNEYEEYKAYDDATGEDGTMESAKALLSSQYERLITLYENEALSELDVDLLLEVYRNIYGEPLVLTSNGEDGDDPEKKLPAILNKRLEKDYSKNQIVRELNYLREIGIYSDIANYCLFKRMNVETEDGYCYDTEYLKNRISEFKLEGIPTDIEESILNGTNEFYSIFEYNQQISKQYDTDTIYACLGKYIKLKEYDNSGDIFSLYTLDELKADVERKANSIDHIDRLDGIVGLGRIIKDVSIYEIDENDNRADEEGCYLYNQLVNLINKLMVANLNNIELPRLKVLDISYNNEHRYDSLRIPGLSKLSQLTKLVDLKAAGNSITDDIVSEILNGTNLRKLDLSDNNITISSLSKLLNTESLQTINLSKNDISGSLPTMPAYEGQENTIDYAKLFKHLKELDLSYNKIDNILGILQYLDGITDDYSNYLATNGNAPKINLNNQQLSITITEPLYLTKDPTTVYIELPKILAQLLAIDEDRAEITLDRNSNIDATSFKTNKGKIGEYVSITPKTPGSKIATFKVTPMNGAYDVDECIGQDTFVEVHYTVVSSDIIDVTVNPSIISLRPGDRTTFNAVVIGNNVVNDTVLWSILGNTSSNTRITDSGELTIGEDETAERITVLAVSNQDNTKSGSATVVLADSNSDRIEISSNKAAVEYGESAELTATLTSNSLEGRNVTIEWKIEDNTSSNTTNVPQGDVKVNETTIREKSIFTLGEDESRDSSVKITAYLSDNPNIYATIICRGTENDDQGDDHGDDHGDEQGDSSKLGYEIKEDYVVGIKTKTPIDAFKDKLVGNQNYTVIVKESDSNGNVNIVTSGNMKTGMTVELQDSNGQTVKDSNGNLLVYEVVVKGDVNGDGVANALDSNIIKAHRMELNGVQLVGSQREAADLNNDGNITVQDSRLLLYHRAEVNGYDLNYKGN